MRVWPHCLHLQLKSSAIEDILRQGTNNATPHMDTLLGGRNWSGRNMGELERGLMQVCARDN